MTTIVFVTRLCAGLHVFRPVGLLAGVITVTRVPAAVEDGLLPAVCTPLFLFGLVHRLLLFQLHLFLHLGHQAFFFLLQTLSHFCHCQLCTYKKINPCTCRHYRSTNHSFISESLPKLCFISDNSCWCSHWSFSISILSLRICGKNLIKYRLM